MRYARFLMNAHFHQSHEYGRRGISLTGAYLKVSDEQASAAMALYRAIVGEVLMEVL